MLNQKKLDIDILEALTSMMPTATTVTLPFTPQSDGILIGFLRAAATGRLYKSYSGTTPTLIDGYQIKDGYFTGLAFCTKGQTVSEIGTSNVSTTAYTFISLD